jgi:hypothetical protein
MLKKASKSLMENHFTGRVSHTDGEDDHYVDASPDVEMSTMHFRSLTGLVLDYYGADIAEHSFKIDKIVFKALEDPDDGYRSYLGAIDYTDSHTSIFFSRPIAKVRIEEFVAFADETTLNANDVSTTKSGYRLVDIEDEHVWVEFGTDYTNDYYPMYIFRHFPKPPVEEVNE